MACSRCGAVAAPDDASCPVCNPWAAPNRQGSAKRTTGGTKRPAARQYSDLPNWLRVLIKFNPPAQADLDKAWRYTVRFTQGSIAFFVLIGVCSALMAEGHQAVFPIFFLLLMGYIFFSQQMRRRSWLSRAVAVVGTRQDIGYRRFARIPALVRVTALNKVASGVMFVLFFAQIITLYQESVAAVVHVGIWVLLWAAAAAAAAISYTLHGAARQELERLLDAPRG